MPLAVTYAIDELREAALGVGDPEGLR